MAKLPTYYVMPLHKGMAATVAPEMPSPAEVTACSWLTEAELEVYAREFARTGLQGSLNWYRCGTDERFRPELEIFSGRTIDVPAMFIAGRADWGTYQRPGAFEAMQRTACTSMQACHVVDGAGHWVQQEQPLAVSRLLTKFLGRAGG